MKIQKNSIGGQFSLPTVIELLSDECVHAFRLSKVIFASLMQQEYMQDLEIQMSKQLASTEEQVSSLQACIQLEECANALALEDLASSLVEEKVTRVLN